MKEMTTNFLLDYRVEYLLLLVSEKNKKSNKNRAAIIGSPFFFGNFQLLNKNMLPWAKLQNISDRQSFLRFFL